MDLEGGLEEIVSKLGITVEQLRALQQEEHSSSFVTNDQVMRMVLVGRTGNGKSSSGNVILGGKYFESKFSARSLTINCSKAEAEVDGQKVAVIDTPGLFDTRFGMGQTTKDIGQCIRFASPGPHVFLVVVKLGRFTAEEQQTVQKIQEIFGPAADRYSMVLFTHGDQLPGSLEEFLNDCPELLELVRRCNGEYQVFNNKSPDRSQVTQLLQKIHRIMQKNGGSHYTNGMFQEAERIIEREKQRILAKMAEKILREKQKIEKDVKAKLNQEMETMKAIMEAEQEQGRQKLEKMMMEERAKYEVERERAQKQWEDEKKKIEEKRKELGEKVATEIEERKKEMQTQYEEAARKEAESCCYVGSLNINLSMLPGLQQQVAQLLQKIHRIVQKNGGSHYTNGMFQEAQRIIEREKQRILGDGAEEMRREKQKNSSRFQEISMTVEQLRALQQEEHSSFFVTNDQVMRIVLVGKTGNGKSETGNVILGRKYFESKFSARSLTINCSKAEAEVDGQKVAVIDTPGLFDTRFGMGQTTKDIGQCIRFASPGPHVFLVVVKLGRFTDEEQQTVQKIQEIFGPAADRYSMVLFTHGDQLPGSLEEFLSESPELLELVRRCNGEYQVFNNKSPDRSQVAQLLQKIHRIVQKNGGSHYTNGMFQEAERIIEREKQRILAERAEEMRREKQKVEDKIKAKFNKEMKRKEAEFKAEQEREKQRLETAMKEERAKHEEERQRAQKQREEEMRKLEEEKKSLKEKMDKEIEDKKKQMEKEYEEAARKEAESCC
ncbi:GTPase IMAP family member 8-like [Synchiropus picturatus]